MKKLINLLGLLLLSLTISLSTTSCGDKDDKKDDTEVKKKKMDDTEEEDEDLSKESESNQQKETADSKIGDDGTVYFAYVAKDVRDGSGDCTIDINISQETYKSVQRYNQDAKGYIKAKYNKPSLMKVSFEGKVLEEIAEMVAKEADTTYLEIDEDNVALIRVFRDSASRSGEKGSVDRIALNHKYISGSYEDFMNGKEITIKPIETSVKKEIVTSMEIAGIRKAKSIYPEQILASDPYCKVIKLESGPIYLSKKALRYTSSNSEATMQFILKEENCNGMREYLQNQ